MYDKIGDVKDTRRRRGGEGFDFLFPSGFDFGLAVALPTKARFQSLSGNGPTSHVFNPAYGRTMIKDSNSHSSVGGRAPIH